MNSRFRGFSVAMVLSAAGLVWGYDKDKKDKKNDPEPTVGKIFYADPKSGNWVQLTSGPDDNVYLNCMDGAGKFQPCVIEAMQPVGLQSPEFPSSFVLQLKPHQKNAGKAKP